MLVAIKTATWPALSFPDTHDAGHKQITSYTYQDPFYRRILQDSCFYRDLGVKLALSCEGWGRSEDAHKLEMQPTAEYYFRCIKCIIIVALHKWWAARILSLHFYVQITCAATFSLFGLVAPIPARREGFSSISYISLKYSRNRRHYIWAGPRMKWKTIWPVLQATKTHILRCKKETPVLRKASPQNDID